MIAPAPVRIFFIQPHGDVQTVDVRVGMSLMEAALRAGVAGIEAKCRGNCACVTCHVHIESRWRKVIGAPEPMEDSMLDFAEGVDPQSRLACQVRIAAGCDGMRVVVAPEQRVLGL